MKLEWYYNQVLREAIKSLNYRQTSHSLYTLGRILAVVFTFVIYTLCSIQTNDNLTSALSKKEIEHINTVLKKKCYAFTNAFHLLYAGYWYALALADNALLMSFDTLSIWLDTIITKLSIEIDIHNITTDENTAIIGKRITRNALMLR